MKKSHVFGGLLALMFSFVSCTYNISVYCNCTKDIKENKHEAVDLGLSVKWATLNVGAKSPGEIGTYFTWGETRIRANRNYSWDTYKWGKENKITKYCTNSENGKVDNRTTLNKEDDVASVAWGGKWRMPTNKELEELIYECIWEWKIVENQPGYKVIGPNGNSIFLPAGGAKKLDKTLEFEKVGDYWANGLFKDDSNSAYRLYFHRGKMTLDYAGPRYWGMSVRPVCDL